MVKENDHCCYYATVDEFLKESKELWLVSMEEQFQNVYRGMLPGEGEKGDSGSWSDTFDQLQNIILKAVPDKKGTYIIFEYKLPEEGGRRPDVLLINKKQICVLEFKRKANADDADIDQTLGYAWDLKYCHKDGEKYDVKPYLVLTWTNGAYNKIAKNGNLPIVSPDQLEVPDFTMEQGITEVEELEKWLNSERSLQPGMLAALKRIKDNVENKDSEFFGNKNTDIENAEEYLMKLRNYAERNRKKVLACVTGVPGAGKTLLGVNFLYENLSDMDAVIYLTPNTALVKVLSSYLMPLGANYSPIVKPLMYCRKEEKLKNIVVIDEGQRVWEQYQKKDSSAKDSNHVFINNIIEKMNKNEWGVLLLICAKGQVIHLCENEGIQGWISKIQNIDRSHEKWDIVCPMALKNELEDFLVNNLLPNEMKLLEMDMREGLNLKECLRTIKWSNLPDFIDKLLDNDFKEAGKCLKKMNDAYRLYITHDLERAKRYCENKYREQITKHYGIVMSSNGDFLDSKIVKMKDKGEKIENWYVHGKSAEWSAVEELDCQGLELDMPIVQWNNDLCWYLNLDGIKNYFVDIYENSLRTMAIADDGIEKCIVKYRVARFREHRKASIWYSKLTDIWPEDGYVNPSFEQYLLKESIQRIKNIYRVLLTRGRDGMIIYVPGEDKNDKVFGDTYEVLRKIGIKELGEESV